MKNLPIPENGFLFAIPAFIWGSTWFAIKFQLGVVAPLLSISYRFVLAGILLLAYCYIRRIDLQFTLKQHRQIALQALFLFGLNYWCTYTSELYVTSGLVAVIFSLVIFFNVLLGRLILKNPIRKQVLYGAVLGILGTLLIFQPELSNYQPGDQVFLGVGVCFLGVIFASLGNITSAYNQRNQLPVVSTNAYGMLYGGLLMLGIALVSGQELSFDTNTSYIVSLLYLAIFGSIIAFGAYLTLIGKIGPDRAAYVLVIMPLIAMIFSAIFEDYPLGIFPILGILLVIVGNVFALKKT